jgi:hypothetical protein
MGASGWIYKVAFQPDVRQALEDLRWQVLRSGEYYRDDGGDEPASPDDALERQPEDGTHSIIDMMNGLSPTPEFGTVSPLTEQQLLAVFGTSTPSSESVETWLDHGGDNGLRDRWEGLVVTGYTTDGAPEFLFFAGASGD